jgi:serine/threonine protein kinase
MPDLPECEAPDPYARSTPCEELERRLRAGEDLRVEDFLSAAPDLAADPGMVLGLLGTEFRVRAHLQLRALAAEFYQRFPDLREALSEQITDHFSGTLSDEDTLVPGQPTGGMERYQVLQEIGQGSQALIFLAWQTDLRRLVALKSHGAGPADPAACARLQLEAEALARLQHPNIVQIYEVVSYENAPCLVLEYVDGGTLACLLSDGPRPIAETAALIETLARAVHHAHLQGVVHCDLKPSNILLTPDGQPKISDFGLARLLVGAGPNTIPEHAILGTPSYMAPEQVAGPYTDLGPAVDIHALGVLLYECLTGRPPFRGNSVLATLRQVEKGQPIPPHLLCQGMPRFLESVCLKCLRKEPDKRYASAQDLANDLRVFLSSPEARDGSNGQSALARLIFKASS